MRPDTAELDTLPEAGGFHGREAFELGLAWLRRGHGQAARAAWRLAIWSGDAEYGTRAACFLAVCCELAGNLAAAREAWQLAVEAPSPRYRVPALLGLAGAAGRAGEADLALACWRRATALLVACGREPP
jgi:tetratricopeptide (TPR) repeat protein